MNRVTDKIKRVVGEFPDFESVRNVYAIIVFIVYSWTLLTSFYNLPSWMFYLTAGQILSIYAYSFLMNLAESLCLLAGVVFLEFTLFWTLKNRAGFQSRSILLILIILASMMSRLILFQADDGSGTSTLEQEMIWWLFILVPGLFIVIYIPKVYWVGNFLGSVAERAVVFFVYLSSIKFCVRNYRARSQLVIGE
jgi:hypothetical protein